MAKPSLIKLEFLTIPAQHFGAFWLFCEEHPGIQFKHQDPAKVVQGAVSKRTKGDTAKGTTAKCIILRMLHESKSVLTSKILTDKLEDEGKARTTYGGAMFDLRKAKHVRSKSIARKGQPTIEGFEITQAGSEWFAKNCNC